MGWPLASLVAPVGGQPLLRESKLLLSAAGALSILGSLLLIAGESK